MHTVEALRRQAVACAEMGSPMYAGLLTRVGDDVEAGGACADVLAGHEDDPGPSALALRLLGSVHRLVLDGTAPRLAEHYPSVGGTWDETAGWRAFERTVREQVGAVRSRLDQAPQTNEVGRAAALMGGLRHVAAEHDLPVRLREIGASGGLNLRAERFCYVDADGRAHAARDSPLRLDGAWRGRRLPQGDVRVVDRLGCDLAPVDLGTDEGRLTLMSYVWPDQVERLERLRLGLCVAATVPAEVRRQDARGFVEAMGLVEGTTTVLWHSVMWQYLSRGDQHAVAARIGVLAGEATPRQPFAHLCMEPMRRTHESEHEFLVVLETWPEGERRVLGTAAPHGVPTTWE